MSGGGGRKGVGSFDLNPSGNLGECVKGALGKGIRKVGKLTGRADLIT